MGHRRCSLSAGGHADRVLHTLGDTESIFTSWTTHWETAKYFASKYGEPGIVLEAKMPASRLLKSPVDLNEFEVLIEGAVETSIPFFATPQSNSRWLVMQLTRNKLREKLQEFENNQFSVEREQSIQLCDREDCIIRVSQKTVSIATLVEIYRDRSILAR